jgi:hypothetical protein
MKKFFLLILVLLLTACSSNNQLNNKKEVYQEYVRKLNSVKKSSSNIPFDIDVKFDKLTKNEVRYQVIIDNPKKDINNITAVAIHNKETQDVFPSIGIFDKKQKLIPNKKPEGIILVGYIPFNKSISKFKCNIKVIIRYSSDKKTNTVYYVTKKS